MLASSRHTARRVSTGGLSVGYSDQGIMADCGQSGERGRRRRKREGAPRPKMGYCMYVLCSCASCKGHKRRRCISASLDRRCQGLACLSVPSSGAIPQLVPGAPVWRPWQPSQECSGCPRHTKCGGAERGWADRRTGKRSRPQVGQASQRDRQIGRQADSQSVSQSVSQQDDMNQCGEDLFYPGPRCAV